MIEEEIVETPLDKEKQETIKIMAVENKEEVKETKSVDQTL